MNCDTQLIIRYLHGETEALEELFQLYLKPIYNFIYRYTNGAAETEDLTQETFVKVWRNLKKFDQTKSFKTWIFHIAKNTALDNLKKKRTIPFSSFEDEEGGNVLTETLKDEDPLPKEILEQKDLKTTLDTYLDQLPLKYKTVIILRHINDFSFQEISETLDLPLDTVKSQHRRGLHQLKKLIIQKNMHPNDPSDRITL